MKAIALLLLVVLAMASVAHATSCWSRFNTCRLSNVAKKPLKCRNDLSTCAVKTCGCLDLNTAAVALCNSTDSASDVDTCLTSFQRDYHNCVQACLPRNKPTNVTAQVHLGDAHVVRLFGLPSKCSICEFIANFAESKGEDFACDSLNLGDLIPGCDIAGPLCGIVLDAVCSKIMDAIVSRTPINSHSLCQHAGMCGKGAVDPTLTSVHHVASVVTLTKPAAARYLTRHASLGHKATQAFCYVQPGTSKYVCTETPLSPPGIQPQLAAASAAATTSSSTGHTSSSHSDLGLGIGIGVVAACTVIGVIGGVVYYKRRRYSAEVL